MSGSSGRISDGQSGSHWSSDYRRLVDLCYSDVVSGDWQELGISSASILDGCLDGYKNKTPRKGRPV